MLRGLRKASSNWLGKTIMAVVMGVLIVSFGIWGIADIFKGFGQSTLAKVGGTEISAEQFRQIYMDKLQQLGRQFGRPLTSEQARAFGLDRQVLQQTIAELRSMKKRAAWALANPTPDHARDLQRSQFPGTERPV
jgi:peptidyl-prolyl cis-trans isomerase D